VAVPVFKLVQKATTNEVTNRSNLIYQSYQDQWTVGKMTPSRTIS